MSQQGDVRTCSTHPAQVQGFEFQIIGIFICRNLAKPSWGKRLLLQTNRIVFLTPSSHVIYFLKSDRSALVQFHLCLLLVSLSFPEETTDFFSPLRRRLNTAQII